MRRKRDKRRKLVDNWRTHGYTAILFRWAQSWCCRVCTALRWHRSGRATACCAGVSLTFRDATGTLTKGTRLRCLHSWRHNIPKKIFKYCDTCVQDLLGGLRRRRGSNKPGFWLSVRSPKSKIVLNSGCALNFRHNWCDRFRDAEKYLKKFWLYP